MTHEGNWKMSVAHNEALERSMYSIALRARMGWKTAPARFLSEVYLGLAEAGRAPSVDPVVVRHLAARVADAVDELSPNEARLVMRRCYGWRTRFMTTWHWQKARLMCWLRG